jgi:hypothetical protein
MATKDDEYNGYFIPAGTTIMGNTWFVAVPFCPPPAGKTEFDRSPPYHRTILHDPAVYPEPLKFYPDRFMDEKGGSGPAAPHDHVNVAFGYGRRICPGRFMADAQLWISIACILSAFEILPGVDETGQYIKTEAAFASGMIWWVPFALFAGAGSNIADIIYVLGSP